MCALLFCLDYSTADSIYIEDTIYLESTHRYTIVMYDYGILILLRSIPITDNTSFVKYLYVHIFFTFFAINYNGIFHINWTKYMFSGRYFTHRFCSLHAMWYMETGSRGRYTHLHCRLKSLLSGSPVTMNHMETNLFFAVNYGFTEECSNWVALYFFIRTQLSCGQRECS